MTAEIAPTPVVGKNEQNVWLGSSIGLLGSKGRAGKEEKVAQK